MNKFTLQIGHVSPTHAQDDCHVGHTHCTCRPDVRDPGGRVAAWTIIETTGGADHESQTSLSDGTSAQDSPEPALEREVVEVAAGKTAVAVITPKLVHRINGDAQDVYDMPMETTKALHFIDDFAVPKRCRR